MIEPTPFQPAIPLASTPFVPVSAPVPAAGAAPTILLSEALAPLRRPAPRDDAAIALTQLAPETLRQPAATGPADPQPPALDTRRQEWIAVLADRMEALRETPGSRETVIRLSPDALGTLDVSISREGDRYHVRIHAETAQARALLAEAQPRLAELAEARGLRLGQTSVEGGAPGHGQGQQPRHETAQHAQQFPSAPPGARSDTDTDDTRVA